MNVLHLHEQSAPSCTDLVLAEQNTRQSTPGTAACALHSSALLLTHIERPPAVCCSARTRHWRALVDSTDSAVYSDPLSQTTMRVWHSQGNRETSLQASTSSSSTASSSTQVESCQVGSGRVESSQIKSSRVESSQGKCGLLRDEASATTASSGTQAEPSRAEPSGAERSRAEPS